MCLLILLLLPCVVVRGALEKPNILFILADDLGFGDFSWSDYSEIPTPNLQRMKEEGTEMMQYYTLPKCTPTRAAFMSGRDPFKTGTQSDVVFSSFKNDTLDLSLKLLPEYLKDRGYFTHLTGKWHLGFCYNKSIPTSRGFDSFAGSFNGAGNDHYFHRNAQGYDWNLNIKPDFEANGTYDTFLVTSRTQQVLQDHFSNSQSKDNPIFIFVSFLAPHKPPQVPEEYISKTICNKLLGDDIRRTYCGMVAAIDESVGNITNTLKALGKLNDTIIIFTSDNGGASNAGASNWPLRGGKQTVYEGGTRARTIIYSPVLLKDAPKEYHGLVHVTDLLPSLYAAASGNVSDLPEFFPDGESWDAMWRTLKAIFHNPSRIKPRTTSIQSFQASLAGIHVLEKRASRSLIPNNADLDGINVWQNILQNTATSRKWMVYNIQSQIKLGALRLKNATHNFKLVYHETDYVPGWLRGRGDPQELTYRKQRYPSPADFYRLFNLDTNPLELEPNRTVPDAAEEYPHVKELMIQMLKEFTAEEVLPAYRATIPGNAPGRPKKNNGAYGAGDCDLYPELFG